MTAINRRELIAGAAAAAGSAIPAAPVARVAVVTDNYFGETLRDPYRWM